MAEDIQIDPRGYRFGAAVTLLVAAVAVLVPFGWASVFLAGLLVLMFLPGATVGPQKTFQSFLFKRLIRPRLGAPAETESFRPPRFAQQMGLGFSALALLFAAVDVAVGFYVFAGFVVVASFLNSVFGFCLGCEIYLLFKRATTRPA